MIKTKIFQAINHVLDQNDWMQDDLLSHKNKTITLRLDKNLFDIQLYISENGQLKVTEKMFENKANLVIQLNTNSLIKMMFKQEPEDIDIHGDMKLAKEINEILKKIEWDISMEVEKYFGLTIASYFKKINEILKKIEWDISMEVEKYFGLTIASYFKKITSLLSKRLKQISKNIAETAVEYYQEENKIFAKEYQVKQFNDEVDQLSIRLEKLKRKMQEIN